MEKIPDKIACFSWNVQQRTTASLQTTGSGVGYHNYVTSTVIGFIEEGEGVATFIGLQGLSTTTFKRLQAELNVQYGDRMICHFTPHSMSHSEWHSKYETQAKGVTDEDNVMVWFGNMSVYFIGLGVGSISNTHVVIHCDSYELPGGSSAMPSINITYKDGNALHLICVHLAEIDTLQAEQQVQLSQVLCQTKSELTLIAGVINRQDCILPGYNSLIQASAAKSHPSHKPVVASSDVWAVQTVCNSMMIKQGPATALRLLHIEQISNHLPVNRMIELCVVQTPRYRSRFGCTIN